MSTATRKSERELTLDAHRRAIEQALAAAALAHQAGLSAEQVAVIEQVRTGRNVFFTGAAGTGKSFVLRRIVEDLRVRRRRVAITATTGPCSAKRSPLRLFFLRAVCLWVEPVSVATSAVGEASIIFVLLLSSSPSRPVPSRPIPSTPCVPDACFLLAHRYCGVRHRRHDDPQLRGHRRRVCCTARARSPREQEPASCESVDQHGGTDRGRGINDGR